MNDVFLSLGSNVGNKKDNLSYALKKLNDLEVVVVEKCSSVYKTAPLYNLEQDFFLNQVVKIKTDFNPYGLLEKIKLIELSMGRDLTVERNMPRIIDLDILAFGDKNIQSNDLTIPHPKILERLFVLEPFKEIAPDYILYGQNLSIKELYNKYLRNRFKNQKVDVINN